MNANDQEHILTDLIHPKSVFEGLIGHVVKEYGTEIECVKETDPILPILARIQHGEKEESLLLYETFHVIKPGGRHWLVSEGKMVGDSSGDTVMNLIALPLKAIREKDVDAEKLREKEIKRTIERFEKTANAAEFVVFSLEHPGVISLNSGGRYAKPEDEDVFHVQRDLVVASKRHDHESMLSEWQKQYKPGAVEFHAKYLAKLLQRSYRRH